MTYCMIETTGVTVLIEGVCDLFRSLVSFGGMVRFFYSI